MRQVVNPHVNSRSGRNRGQSFLATSAASRLAMMRITRAQQLIRAVTAAKQRPGFPTRRSLIEIGLDVGYKNPSHFAQVFRRMVGVRPTDFRSAL
ncbi:MAG TPA: helix-turn-helix domain-containing protein [Chthoniobacterales bacterium]|nr:helix-turn-helix domain-containing protein [Chthoniobacterales bacterium]